MAENRRTTVYLEPDLHRALRLKSVEGDCSISDLVNSAVRRSLLEDAENLAAHHDPTVREDRAAEATVQYGAVVAATDLRHQAVEDGIAWLQQVADEPSADPRPSLELLREVRATEGGEQGATTPADAGSTV